MIYGANVAFTILSDNYEQYSNKVVDNECTYLLRSCAIIKLDNPKSKEMKRKKDRH